jgi:hypothetical protein
LDHGRSLVGIIGSRLGVEYQRIPSNRLLICSATQSLLQQKRDQAPPFRKRSKTSGVSLAFLGFPRTFTERSCPQSHSNPTK